MPLSAKALGGDGAFAPQDAVRLQAERGRQVGLVIDLTNTTRYYDPVEWDHLRVQHVKVSRASPILLLSSIIIHTNNMQHSID